MHACGHDVHMTCLVGTARWLAEHKDRWSGTVVLIGQPAEEMIGGAKAMLDDGLYTRFPRPDFALALHVTHDLPTGTVAYTRGPGDGQLDRRSTSSIRARAATARRRTRRSTRSSWPPWSILDLQTIVSREIDPIQPAVVTVGSIHGGTKHNIIPDEVKLQLTLRAYRDDVRDQLIDGIKRRVDGPGPGPPRPRADRRDRREHPADDQHARASSTGSCPSSTQALGDVERQGGRARRWGPRTSASSAAAACRPSCSASARSRPPGSPRRNPKGKRSPRSTRPPTTPSPGQRPDRHQGDDGGGRRIDAAGVEKALIGEGSSPVGGKGLDVKRLSRRARVKVTDVGRSVAWYTGVLGFSADLRGVSMATIATCRVLA